MKRYFLGVDWADEVHQVLVSDSQGSKVAEMKEDQNPERIGEFGRWLHERRAGRDRTLGRYREPEGRIVDFLLDDGVVVPPIIRKRWMVPGTDSHERLEERFCLMRMFCRSFCGPIIDIFRALRPNSEPAQELKMLTRDYQRLVTRAPDCSTKWWRRSKITIRALWICLLILVLEGFGFY